MEKKWNWQKARIDFKSGENMYLDKIVQYLITDSIKVNMQVYPHEAFYYGKQYQSRASQRIVRAFKSKCLLERSSRSEHNPHGFIITNYELLENPIIKN